MLYNLGNTWSERYEDVRGSRNLHEAIKNSEDAVLATPLDEPDRAMKLNRLGSALTNRFLMDRDFDDLVLAKHAHCPATEIENAPPIEKATGHRCLAALLTGEARHTEATEESENAVALLQRVSPRLLSRDEQQRVLDDFSALPCVDATSAVRAGWPASKVLQVLESGRCIIAGFAINARSDVVLLKEKYPDVCERYERCRTAFASLTSMPGANTSDHYLASTESREKALSDLSKKENEIRKLPDFERFQKSLDENRYMRLAERGPVVIFNVSPKRSDAIIIDSSIRIIHLQDLHYSDMAANLKSVSALSGSRHRNMELVDDSESEQDRKPDIPTILRWLWDVAVEPIQGQLGPSCQRRRIWWVTCGVMSFAPIHAAGDHSAGSSDFTMNHVISSYISGLMALHYARARQQTPRDYVKRMLLATMTKTLGAAPLNVQPEVEAITHIFGHSIYSLLYAQKEQVLKSLLSSSFAHFACHGTANLTDPAQGGLVLLDKDRNVTLTISELDRLNLKYAEIAYLSACSTAEISGTAFIDEATHLANSFKMIGFRHVIGTMWAADDGAAAEIAGDFYRSIQEHFKNLEELALHTVILSHKAKLDAQENAANWSTWAPLSHVGT